MIFPGPGVGAGTIPREQQSGLITLTTCHPWSSAEQRLVVHGVLTERYPKQPDQPELARPNWGTLMYAWTWRRLGPAAAKLLPGRGARDGRRGPLLLVIFPGLEPRLPFNEVTAACRSQSNEKR